MVCSPFDIKPSKMLTSHRRFISKKIPASEKQSSGKPEKEKEKPSSEKPSSQGMTGPRLAALYKQLKQQQSEAQNGETHKLKASGSAVTNGSSRGESSKSNHS